MRAALHGLWPALAHWFGLYPDDVERFSPAEWQRYVEALDEINRDADRARRGV